ncbi:MAG: TonB-dependent receptor [Gemmatimonadales bacterium]
MHCCIARATRHGLRVHAVLLALAIGALASPRAALSQAAIAGTVLSARSLGPVAGVRVEVVGTGVTATSDAQGRFRLEGVTGAAATLRAIGIGFRPVTVSARVGDLAVRILVTEAAINLGELVVTGTAGPVERRAVANAISKIDAEEALGVSPATDVSQLMRGRAAGALVRTATGTVGGGSRITLRGAGTLGLSDQPLIYVDGLRVDSRTGVGMTNEGAGSPNGSLSRLNDFSPEDIESIEIIKGPAAATLYGTEASNGVIQIITKRGRRGDATWAASMRQGATWFQNPEGRFRSAYGLDGSGTLVEVNPYELALSQGERPFRTGHLQGYSLNVSGGSGTTSYYASAEFNQDDGTDLSQRLEEYKGRMNLQLTPSEQLDARLSLGYVRSNTRVPNDGTFGGPMWAFANVRPSLLGTVRNGWLFASPDQWNRAFDYRDEVDRFTTSLQLNHRPTGWLQHRLAVGADIVSDDFGVLSEKMPPDLELAFGLGLASGRRQTTARDVVNTTVDYGISGEARLGGRFVSTTSAGFQYYHRRIQTVTTTARGFPAAGIQTVSAAATRDAGEDIVENNTVGLYLQEQLAINDRLFLVGALRADDNSAFGSNFDVATYPKASVSWVISDEPFWNLGFLGTTKLRAAYGVSGQQPDAFAALRTFEPITGSGGVPAITPSLIGNPDLKPERSRELELGFDASLLRDRVGVELTWYHKRTTDAIVTRQLAPSNGFPGQQYVNAGEVRSKGVELLVNARVLDRESVGLDLVANVTTSANDVIDTGSETGFIATPGTAQRHTDGYPVAAFFGQKVVSATLNPTTGLAESILCDGGTGVGGWDAGGPAVDCGSAPFVFLGRSLPSAFGSFSATLTLFDRVQLYGLVDFQTGFSRRDWEAIERCGAGTCEEAWYPERFDVQKVAEQQLRLFTSYSIHDAGFAKLRELSVRYALPDRWAGIVGAKRATVRLSGRNLRTWTNYPGLDPEPVRLSQTFNVNQFAIVPPQASVLARLDVTF